jgi:hypothetical protein
MLEILNQCAIDQISNGATAAETAVTSSVLDMSGYDGVLFIASLATVVDTSVLGLTAYENTANSTSGGTAVTNGAATFTASGSSNTLLVVDVIRPKNRYLYCTLTRTTANATLNNIVAVRYRGHAAPVTQGATVLAAVTSTPEV